MSTTTTTTATATPTTTTTTATIATTTTTPPCFKDTSNLIAKLASLYQRRKIMVVEKRRKNNEEEDGEDDEEDIASVAITAETSFILSLLAKQPDTTAIQSLILQTALGLQEELGCGALYFIHIIGVVLKECFELYHSGGRSIYRIIHSDLPKLEKALKQTLPLPSSLSHLCEDQLSLVFHNDSASVRLLLSQTPPPDFLFLMPYFANTVLPSAEIVSCFMLKMPLTYAGHNKRTRKQQPAQPQRVRLLLCDGDLEMHGLADNIRLSSADAYTTLVNTERHMLLSKLKQIELLQAQIVLCKGPVGDVATQYLAKHGIVALGRIPARKLTEISHKLGIPIIQRFDEATGDADGSVCGLVDGFEEDDGAHVLKIYHPLVRTFVVHGLSSGPDDDDDGVEEEIGCNILRLALKRIEHVRCGNSNGTVEEEVLTRAVGTAKTVLNVDQTFYITI